MFKERLRKQQPIAYQTLENALCQDRLAHAYMFNGPSGTGKKEAAYLLAQSILCDAEGFACESCAICQRVLHDEYSDMIYLDGSTKAIKKEDIMKLQSAFSKTGLEGKGKKIYILDHAENATVDALNSLLKFLEEPNSDMIAILLVEALDRVLPTIVSRCQIIPFIALGSDVCYNEAKAEIDDLDAYLLSRWIRQKDAIVAASETEDYQHARFVFQGVVERYLVSPHEALLFLQLEGFPSKQKKYGKQAFGYVVDMLNILMKDAFKGSAITQDSWYQKQLTSIADKNYDYRKLAQIFMDTKDKLLRSVNIQLLADQMLYKMKEVMK